MRSMQFGGKPIEVAPNRIFNCVFMPATTGAALVKQCFFSSAVLEWVIRYKSIM